MQALEDIQALRQRAAGPKPIISLGEQSPFKIEHAGMDAEWKREFDASHPTHDVLPDSIHAAIGDEGRKAIAAMRLKLKRGLLKFGGDRVFLADWEPDLGPIVERGQLFGPEGLRMARGWRNGCHGNAARLWREKRGTMLIATGYYLCHEGLWRQHSWCVEARPRKPRVVETTVPAIAYFGYVMTEAEASTFAADNA